VAVLGVTETAPLLPSDPDPLSGWHQGAGVRGYVRMAAALCFVLLLPTCEVGAPSFFLRSAT